MLKHSEPPAEEKRLDLPKDSKHRQTKKREEKPMAAFIRKEL
jgi:hypothetical protein